MRKINAKDAPNISWTSPGGKYAGSGLQLSEGLGRDPLSTDMLKRHPFDVEIMRIPVGKLPYPYHSHSAQWEFYYVLSGSGSVRADNATVPVVPGDAVLFLPGEAHQFVNDGSEDLVVLVVADNPIGESCYYPDSGKWAVRSPERRLLRSDPLEYYDGEE